MILNEIISKKLYNLSKEVPEFFKKLNSVLTLQLFQRESTLIDTSLCLTMLKKTGDLYYLFYKCHIHNDVILLEQWKQFLIKMMKTTTENYEFFQEIQDLFSMSLEAISKSPDVINRILAKKTKKILFYYLQNDSMKSFQISENFSEICLKENPFIEYLINFNLANQGRMLDKYFKLLKKENNELAFLKLSLLLLKILHVFFSKDDKVSQALQNFTSFSINLLFWRLAKIMLFYHNGSLSLLFINYLIFAFEKLFINNKYFAEDYSINFLFLFCSFLVVFKRNARDELIIIEAKKKLYLIIEQIFQIIDQPYKFIAQNFYLEIIFEDNNLKNLFFKALNSDSKNKFKKTANNIKFLIDAINENKHFPEKSVLLLYYLKNCLLKIYIDNLYFSNEELKAMFSTLMKVSNAKDLKRLSLKERFTNNNQLHLEKTVLLLECFGIIGALSQSNLPNLQLQEIYFEKNLTPQEISKTIYVFIFFLEY